MRRSVFLVVALVCLLLTLAFPLIALCVDLAVVNGDFETSGENRNDIVGWIKHIGQVAERVADPKDAGNNVLHFTPSSGSTEYCQTIEITDPTWSSLEVSARVLMIDYVGGKIEIALTDTEDCTDVTETRQTVVDIGDELGTDEWTPVSKSVALCNPPDYIAVFLSGEENKLYFDDVEITASGGSTDVRLSQVSAAAENLWILPSVAVAALALHYALGRRRS